MKKANLLAGISIFAILVVILASVFPVRKQPYRKLDLSEIASATVRLTPPDKTLQITELTELADLLNDVVIYNEDQSYTQYAGQGVTFMLTMADGTVTEIMAYNPFLVIDGVGYKTKYEPCEALNRYANRLLNEEAAPVVLDEPPRLDIVSDNTSVSALLGTYSWSRPNDGGTFTSVEACSGHPLEYQDMLIPLETTQATAALRFVENPDQILSVRCWSDAYWSDCSAPDEEAVLNGYELQLNPGGYIYEINARWNSELGGGSAYYFFYIERLD